MGTAAVRNFLAHGRKMGSSQENWEEEGKSLITENKVARNTKNPGGPLRLEKVERKENTVEGEEEKEKTQWSWGVFDAKG